MKKLLSLCLAMLLLLAAVPALADDYDYIQPYGTVELSVFKDAGYELTYNEMSFEAELTNPTEITVTVAPSGSTSDTYTFAMDLRMIWNGYTCVWYPRLILSVNGSRTRTQGMLDKVYIKVGENRYTIDVDNVSRYESSYSFTASESVVEPFGPKGLEMLRYITSTDKEVQVSFDNRGIFTLKDTDIAVLKDFVDLCEKAGVFSQDSFRYITDNYSTLTKFNKD